MAERRLSIDSDYGLNSSSSTIDPNDTIYSQCSSCLSLVSEDDDVFEQDLGMRCESLESLTDNMSKNGVSEILAFKNTDSLSEDLQTVNGITNMCDVKFLVGPHKTPVYGVKAILCARSRVMYTRILCEEKRIKKDKLHQRKRRRSLFSFLRGKRQKKQSDASTDADLTESTLLVLDVPDTDPDVFSKLVQFLHSGSITVEFSSVMGMLSVAEEYDLDELANACYLFAEQFITETTVLLLLDSAYHSQKTESDMSKKLLNQALEFVDKSAHRLLELDEFVNISQQTALKVISRPTLRASEESKWDCALRWSRRHCQDDVTKLRDTLKLFTPNINLLQIPLSKLMSEVTPLCSTSAETLLTSEISNITMGPPTTTTRVGRRRSRVYRKDSVSSACSSISMASRSTDSGYISYFRESCLL